MVADSSLGLCSVVKFKSLSVQGCVCFAYCAHDAVVSMVSGLVEEHADGFSKLATSQANCSRLSGP